MGIYYGRKLYFKAKKINRQMRDGINKAARIVINHCLENNIGTVVFGWNKRNKDSINIGKKNNSEFVPIPTARLKDRIATLCEQYGIQLIKTEESYTSKASFLDGDYLPTYGEKPVGEASLKGLDWKPSGRRTKRGLYRVGYGQWYINADCNGAANIIRKVATTLSILSNISLDRVSRGVLSRPQRYRLWSVNRKVEGIGFNHSRNILLESPSEALL